METTKEKIANYFSNEDNRWEKKGIVYLIILSIVLAYFSTFFIHDILERGALKDTKSVVINYPDNPINIVDNEGRFKIYEGSKEWSELRQLNIFNNSYYNGEAKIAPGVSGTYTFTVENYAETAFKYNLTYTEDNPYNVNMKYKLKINGSYAYDTENKWVDYSDLGIVGRVLPGRTTDLYTLEWKWVDAQNDTEVGETENAYYKLNIKSYAEEEI